jgi:predicted acyltransferase
MSGKDQRLPLDPEPEGVAAPVSTRLASLDVFRGLTVAGMILVNNPGSWSTTYKPLLHASWDGWTPTDLVFPFFLFIVGVAITFALGKRIETGNTAGVVGKVVRRSLILFALGLFLNRFPFFRRDWHELLEAGTWGGVLESIRIPGVLQRIALCYLAGSLIFLKTSVRGQVFITSALLLGYWAVMKLVAAPGFAAGDLARGHDLASYVDRMLLPKHLYKSDYDPEGLLSTLPAIATTLCGVLAGHWLRSGREGFERASGLFAAGAVAIVVGLAWNGLFPINKALWTSSFVLLTAGLALQGLALCYWLVDLQGYKRLTWPFAVFGNNAIFAYTLAAIDARLLGMIRVETGPDKLVTVHQLVLDRCLTVLHDPYLASLGYALTFVVACWVVTLLLHVTGLRIRA